MMRQAERNAQVMMAVSLGHPYSDIASAFGLSRSAVAGIVARNRKDYPNPGKVMHRKSAFGYHSQTAAARAVGKSEAYVRRCDADTYLSQPYTGVQQ